MARTGGANLVAPGRTFRKRTVVYCRLRRVLYSEVAGSGHRPDSSRRSAKKSEWLSTIHEAHLSCILQRTNGQNCLFRIRKTTEEALFVRMLMCSGAVLFRLLTVVMCGGRVFFRNVMLAMIVKMRGLQVMVRRSCVMGGGLVMMLGGRM